MRRGRRILEELDRDIREHIERETQDNIERGMTPEEARYAAVRKFGNVTRVKEETRDVWRIAWIEDLWQDIRYGLPQILDPRDSPHVPRSEEHTSELQLPDHIVFRLPPAKK